MLLSSDSLSDSIILGNDLRNYGNVLSGFKETSPSIFKVVEGIVLLRHADVDPLFEYETLEPKHGEEYWDAFSDLCLMWLNEE